ncbi:MAG: hypothetical protein FJ386_13050 [Verrucomicrobia bacterium]|nr:hypothetical protein [Verrucomicrobiota bacterium]
MNIDISTLLEHWDYQPGQVVVRKFTAKDGSEKLQLRVDLGILQMNLTGRPDGKRPRGHESWFLYYKSQAEHNQAGDGGESKFKLKPEDVARLQQEAIQYHHRYICLYQLEDFDGVDRDTARNLQVFDFASEFAASGELAWSLQQFRPQLLLMRYRALGTKLLREPNHEKAAGLIEEGIEQLRSFYREHERPELIEHSGEITSLELWLNDIRSKRPLSEREKLEIALNEAVAAEDYEKAARVRDALKKLQA